MGIVRTVEWKLSCSPEETDSRFRQALEKLGMAADGAPGQVHGAAKRSMLKNRWAAEFSAELSATVGGTIALCRVDMLGNKHYALLSEVAEAVGDEVFDDRGVTAAIERLGKAGRLFGRKEIRHLQNILHANERVLELGQGQFGNSQGLLVLSTQRLFFFEKSLGSETIEEFSLKSISSLSVSKKMGGEMLKVHVNGQLAVPAGGQQKSPPRVMG